MTRGHPARPVRSCRWLVLVLALFCAAPVGAEPPASGTSAGSSGASQRPPLCENLSSQALEGYKVPGRKPDSEMPWELFLGNASHRLIAYIYRTRYPANRVFYNKDSIKTILEEADLGDWSQLSERERKMCPDITNVTVRETFEIKPSGERGLRDGERELAVYLLALNRTLSTERKFSGGRKFEGEILIQFARGQYIWKLEWCTNRPGVTQYRWTRSQERFDSNVAAYQAGRWGEISEQELKQYGGWVAQAVEGMVDRRELLIVTSEAIGMVIDVMGRVALVALSAAMSGERGVSSSAGQGPATGGTVLPFPVRAAPPASPVQLPRASGM